MLCLLSSDSESEDEPERVSLDDHSHPIMRKHCKPGHGQIYWIRPKISLSKSGSNGYVGQNLTRLLYRIRGHLTPNSGCVGIANAIKAHGVGAFTVEILQADVPIDQVDQAEIYWIAAQNTWHGGYNCGEGGKSSTMDDPEVRARHKAAVKASHNTPEYLKKASEISKVSHSGPEYKKGARKRALAQHQDPTKKQAMSDGLKKGWIKRKASGKTKSMSVTAKKVMNDPVNKAKRAKALTLRTDEEKKARSDACKAAKARLTPEQRSEAVRKSWLKRKGLA